MGTETSKETSLKMVCSLVWIEALGVRTNPMAMALSRFVGERGTGRLAGRVGGPAAAAAVQRKGGGATSGDALATQTINPWVRSCMGTSTQRHRHI